MLWLVLGLVTKDVNLLINIFLIHTFVPIFPDEEQLDILRLVKETHF